MSERYPVAVVQISALDKRFPKQCVEIADSQKDAKPHTLGKGRKRLTGRAVKLKVIYSYGKLHTNTPYRTSILSLPSFVASSLRTVITPHSLFH